MAFRDPGRFVTQALGQSHEVYDLGRVWASGNGDANPSHPGSSDAHSRASPARHFTSFCKQGEDAANCNPPSWLPLPAGTVMVMAWLRTGAADPRADRSRRIV